jgi:hypothetical protein
MSSASALLVESRCEVCRSSANLHCLHCQLDYCLPCLTQRHSLGSLGSHRFSLLATSSPDSSRHSNALDVNRLCQVCESSYSVCRCPICDLCFCHACTDQWHNIGNGHKRAQWIAHKLKFEFIKDGNFNDFNSSQNPLSSGSSGLSSGNTSVSSIGAGARVKDKEQKVRSDEFNPLPSPQVSSLPHYSSSQLLSTPTSSLALQNRRGSVQYEAYLAKRRMSLLSDSGADSDSETDNNEPPIHEEPVIIFHETVENSSTGSSSHVSPAVTRRPSTVGQVNNTRKSLNTDGNNESSISPLRFVLERRGSASNIPTSSHQVSYPNSITVPSTPAHHRQASGGGFERFSALAAFANSSSPQKKIPLTTSTFKLQSYQLTYPSKSSETEHPEHFSITIDPQGGTITITSSNGEIYHTRHFLSIESAAQEAMDERKFILQYKDTIPISKCQALQANEAQMICSIINQQCKEWKDQVNNLTGDMSDNVLFIARLLKKGKMSYSARWVLVKKFTAKLFKSMKSIQSAYSSTPSINLIGCKIRLQDDNWTSKDKEKCFCIDGIEKPVTFKCTDSAERDTIVALIQKAVEV